MVVCYFYKAIESMFGWESIENSKVSHTARNFRTRPNLCSSLGSELLPEEHE